MHGKMVQLATSMDDGQCIPWGIYQEEPQGVPVTSTLRQAGESLPQAMKRIKMAMIENMLNSCGGSRTQAASRLGISRSNLQKTMKRLGIT